MSPELQPDIESKKKAVSLRLAGATLIEVAKKTELSAPIVATLIQPMRMAKGKRLNPESTGVRPKSGGRLAAEGSKALRSAFLGERLQGKSFGPVYSAPDLAAYITERTAEQTDGRAAMRRLTDFSLKVTPQA